MGGKIGHRQRRQRHTCLLIAFVFSTAQPEVEESRKAAPEKQAKKARKQQGGKKKSPKAAGAATTRVVPKKLQAGGHKGKARLGMAPVAKAVRV